MTTNPRGFARMTPERRREVAASGGRARKAPKHVVLIDNGVRCQRCHATKQVCPADVDEVITSLKSFLREHRQCAS